MTASFSTVLKAAAIAAFLTLMSNLIRKEKPFYGEIPEFPEIH